jgi:hypothetical protein
MTVNDVSVRAVLALVSLGSAGYLWAIGEPVSDAHLALVATINGFYFGSRTTESHVPPPAPVLRQPVDLDRIDLLRKP